MNCPMRGEVMEAGYIQSSGRIVWGAKKHENIFLLVKERGYVALTRGISA